MLEDEIVIKFDPKMVAGFIIGAVVTYIALRYFRLGIENPYFYYQPQFDQLEQSYKEFNPLDAKPSRKQTEYVL